MKVLLLLVVVCAGYVSCAPEAPVAPYAPSGWRPKGPAFELPTRNTEQEAPDAIRTGKEEQVEITEEEVQYTGETGTTESDTTPFLEYGPPEDTLGGEYTTIASDVDNDLSVQGLPSSEPAKEFRVLPAEPLNQKLRAQRQKTGRLQSTRQFVKGPQFQRQEIATFSAFQAPNQFGVGVLQTGQRNGKNFGQGVSQFGQFRANALRPVAFAQPVFFQRQEIGAEPIGVPAQVYGPSNEYGPPAQEPQQVDVDQPEQPQAEPEVPPQEDVNTTEPNELADGDGGENVVAISNSFAERLTQGRQGKSAKLRASGPSANLRNERWSGVHRILDYYPNHV